MGGTAAGSGGAALVRCIDGWPTRPAAVQKAVPLSVQPQTLWTVDLPVKGGKVGALMAATGKGVAFSFANMLFIYDSNGKNLATVPGASSAQNASVSTPVTGTDGSVYFADSVNAYGLDGSGKATWTTPIPGGGVGIPLLDGGGQLYMLSNDGGTLHELRASDGKILSTFALGSAVGGLRHSYAGVGEAVLLDGEATSTMASEGVFSATQGAWIGQITVGAGRNPPSSIVGYDIGIVTSAYLDIKAETVEVDILDHCGQFRWRVPGSYAIPLAITFDDDLIIMDRVPNGQPSPLDHDFSLRRFSKDGTLLAGPVSVPDQFCGRAFVGADDTFYYTGGASDGYRLRAYDSSLNQLWTTPFPHCPDAALLNGDGKVFTARGVDGKLVHRRRNNINVASVHPGHHGTNRRNEGQVEAAPPNRGTGGASVSASWARETWASGVAECGRRLGTGDRKASGSLARTSLANSCAFPFRGRRWSHGAPEVRTEGSRRAA